MITSETYDFLRELKENNNREWFDSNRKRYEKIRENLVQVTEILIHEISQIDRSVAGLVPKDCLFRINRDIRFSNDKSPYKTNMGVFIAPGGKNSINAGYYMHIEPGGSFIGGGIYMPPSPVLKTIREEILNNYEEFTEIISHKDFTSNFSTFWGEKLKTKPKGFPDDFEGIEYLRLKNYTVLKEMNDKQMISSTLIDTIKKVFGALYPLNRFINNAIAG
jgi:uncharacterized protein (TIGR02453 family)